MAKAYQCDRCHTFYVGEKDIDEPVVVTRLGTVMQKRIDLCEPCTDILKSWLSLDDEVNINELF